MNTVVSLVKPKCRSLLSVASGSNRLCSGNSLITDKENNLSNCARVQKKSRSSELPRSAEDDGSGLFKIIKPEMVRVNRSNPTDYVADKNRVTKGANGPRINEMNIQMLSEGLYHQIYGGDEKQNEPDPKLIESAQAFLKEHGLWMDEINLLEDVSLDLPPLKGKNIEEHFMNIGKEQAEPYKKLLLSFANNGIPSPPKHWLCQKGWTKYVDGKEPRSVPFPDEDALVFDVEVCVKLGELPTLATAVSPTAWYGWVSSDLANGIDSVPTNNYKTDMLIPLEGGTISKEKPRIVIGHNVSYDRARVKEQYYIKNSALRFLDTMSIHTCIGGTNRQMKVGKSKSAQEEMDLWQPQFCLSSLKDIYLLYCNKELNKEVRNVFLEGDLSEVRKDFQVLMNYCAEDVKATYEVFQTIFNTFLSRFPHPVTLAGMLEMGTAYLPVNYNWTKFIAESEHTYNDLKHEISCLLSKKSDNACRLLHNEEYKKDLWMWSEDWSTQQLKLIKGRRGKKKENDVKTETSAEETKAETSNEDEDITEVELSKKFQYLFDLEDQLPLNKPVLPGYPLWYRKLFEKPSSENWTPHPQLTTGLIITPKLLKLTWEDFPLHHTHELGWGILVADIFCTNACPSMPFEKIKELTLKNCKINSNVLEALNFDRNKRKSKSVKNIFHVPYYKGHGILSGEMIDDCCYFFKLPHKYGRGNVGSPLSNDFSQTFNNSLKGSDSVAGKLLDMRKKLTYWRNNRERIAGQMVVWLNKNDLCDEEISSGVIIPKVVVCGTVTRRAMENTWLTASKVIENRIGSELRSMIQAPPGYHIVGADVDSQELWIASLIGDSNYAKVHGCTPIGWMTLSGTKANGSDMHSVTAKTIGISRNHAKIINYARIYGAGVHFAQRLVQEFNPTMTVEEAKAKARKMYDLTKGKKVFKLKRNRVEEFRNAFGSEAEVYDIFTATRVAKYMGRKLDEVFEKSHWVNGTESDMFNELEKIANSYKPVTPFLRCRLSSSLEPKFEGDDFYMSTRVNWVVQSGAVDFLHLMLVCMRWLTNGRAKYCFSFHDEVRYLIPSEERYNAALAMHITNLLVRAFCAYRLGIKDLPLSVAFFSAVDVDTTLRKEANDDCITPSNPHGIEKGYGIPPGESLSIYETIKKSNGSLALFGNTGIKPATKRKHVHREVLQGELVPPEGNQQIVRVIGSRGNNLHEVETPESTTFLVSMPTKFRKNVWIKKGDYILVEPIEEGEKVKAEMVKVLTPDYIKFLKKENIWPNEFTRNKDEQSGDDNDLCINNNRNAVSDESESEEETD